MNFYPTYYAPSFILLAAAVIPAIALLVYVYKHDTLEKESSGLLKKLVISGILSTVMAIIIETVGEILLDILPITSQLVYDLLLYFIIVGIGEEFSKYFFMKRATWNNPEFNCQFDGIVYAVFVSMGFAIWENIKYVMMYGFGTALIRAVTAVPGHASFGVFMGVFYGAAKRADSMGYKDLSQVCRFLALFVPVLIHGTYDFIASQPSEIYTLIFFVFIILLFVFAKKMVKKIASIDAYF